MENITLIVVKSPPSNGSRNGKPDAAKPQNSGPLNKPPQGVLAGMTIIPKVKAAAAPMQTAQHITDIIPATTPLPVGTPDNTTVVQKPSLKVSFLGAGLAACIAEVVTFPLDTTKVRLQIQGESVGIASNAAKQLEFNGVIGTLSTLARKEGLRAWYQGLTAGLQRQMCFASVRIGLYDVIKQKYCRLFNTSPDHTNFHIRILAGITSGASAILCFQPTDVVKTRLQAQTSGKKRYNGAIHAYRTIATQEGILGLWKGLGPNITRNCIVNVSELVTYDLFKEYLLNHRILNDNMPCHFVAAAGAGFVTTVLASPVDVVKTRFMNSTPGQYKGAVHCALLMAKREGPQAFYKGCLPSFLRLTSWSIVMFVSYEQIKRVFTSGLNTDEGSFITIEDVMPMVDRLPSLEEVLDTSGPSRFM